MEYYSAINNEVLTHATMWISLDNIMASERNMTQKVIYRMIPFMQTIQNKQIHRDREKISSCQSVVAREQGEKDNDCSMSMGFLLGVMKKYEEKVIVFRDVPEWVWGC